MDRNDGLMAFPLESFERITIKTLKMNKDGMQMKKNLVRSDEYKNKEYT